MSPSSPPAPAPLPTRRGLLKRLSGLVAGSVLAGPLQALLGRATPATAGTHTGATGFVGEIILVAFDLVPKGYASCDGQLLPINQNTALFALLGTTYGGNGTTTFALPNLNGRVPIGAGQGPGLTNRALGASGGSATVTLQTNELPAHAHTLALTYSTGPGTTGSPVNAFLASNASGLPQYATTNTGRSASGAVAVQPHSNEQPYLVLNYYIALQGIFPSRS